jgi:cellulose synthase/poly-beta-1,6-N-acetylglucosamine synthase-like glycosyltransferase
MPPRRPANIAAERSLLLRREFQDLKSTLAAPDGAKDQLSDRLEQLNTLLSEVTDGYVAALERLERLTELQHELDTRIRTVENSAVFRGLRAAGGYVSGWKAKARGRLLEAPLPNSFRSRLNGEFTAGYRLWSRREEERLSQRYKAQTRTGPVISVLMQVHNPGIEGLAASIQSIRHQSYGRFELSICDNGSSDPHVTAYIAECARSDERISLCYAPEHGSISRALNLAGAAATGQYVAVMDAGDLLPPYALSAMAEAAAASGADVIYSDEDRLDEKGERKAPVFKPCWSPNLLLSCMYAGRLLVIARQAVERAGWFRPECDGSHEYDLLLRVTDAAVQVQHVPHVLYHAPEAVATSGAEARRRDRIALWDAVERRGWDCNVEDGDAPGRFRLRGRAKERPLVSIVICTRTLRLFKKCFRQLRRRTDYRPFEVIVVHHLTGDDDALKNFIERSQCVRVPYMGVFNNAVMNNLGSEAARGEILLFLNDDIEPLSRDWLDALVDACGRPGVGIAGAKLLYPSGMIQHAGIALGISDGCGHIGRGLCSSSVWPWLDTAREVSAVTGACLAIPASLFQDAGGFRTMFSTNYGDVDLCMRIRARGLSVLFEPAACLEHVECGTRVAGTLLAERDAWYREWHVDGSYEDPFYSRNLAKTEDLSLRADE